MVRWNVISRVLMLLLLFVPPAAVGAAAKPRHTVHFPRELQVGGMRLEPGDYTVSWEAHGSDATVTVTIARDGQTVLTTKGRLVLREVKYDRDMVVYVSVPDGSPQLLELRFAGKKEVLVFGQ